MTTPGIVFELDTAHGYYQIVDTIYTGRKARLLYSGDHLAAQSGLALDDRSELLFDYNERFMELLRGRRPQRVLLLGGGAYTLPRAVGEQLPETELVVVEPDGQLLKLAKTYFGFHPTKHITVYNTDGLTHLKCSSECFDLIIIDAFIHARLPATLTSAQAARLLKDHLAPDGVVAMNIIAAYYGKRGDELRQQVSMFQQAFRHIGIFPASAALSLWLPQNFILTAYNQGVSPADNLRYAPLAMAE